MKQINQNKEFQYLPLFPNFFGVNHSLTRSEIILIISLFFIERLTHPFLFYILKFACSIHLSTAEGTQSKQADLSLEELSNQVAELEKHIKNISFDASTVRQDDIQIE